MRQNDTKFTVGSEASYKYKIKDNIFLRKIYKKIMFFYYSINILNIEKCVKGIRVSKKVYDFLAKT